MSSSLPTMNVIILLDIFYFRALNMHYIAFGALWAFFVFYRPQYVAAEALPTLQMPQQIPDEVRPIFVEQVLKRQTNDTGICKAYGVDYQDGGSYFIDQRSVQPFQAVTKFEGCEVSDADVLLVDRQTTTQYLCGRIATTPDDAPQMATCEVRERDMGSGNWSLLILGDNAQRGKPFAYQRDFTLTVAPQQTVTISKTCIYTYTEKPTRTITSTSSVVTTNLLPNALTLTRPAATNVITITPKASTLAATSTTFRTFTTWTRTEKRETVTVRPTCRVPPKPMLRDGMCKIRPTIVPVPSGVRIAAADSQVADRAVDVNAMRKRIEHFAAVSSRVHASPGTTHLPLPPPPSVVAGDQPTVTLTGRYPVNVTTTTTLPAKTIQIVYTTTNTVPSTAPPNTILSGTAMQTTYAPAKTVTEWRKAFTRVYEVQTMSVAWTWTSIAPANAAATEECRAKGGRIG